MATGTTWNRRALFSRSAWRSLPPRSECILPLGSGGDVVIARRAMACEFSVHLSESRRDAVAAGQAALDEVDRLERKLSAYDDESDVCALNRSAAERPVPIDDELEALLRTAGRLYEETAGAFDPASGALVRAWGFFRGPRRVPSDDEREAALAACGWRHVRLEAGRVSFERPVELNLGAIGKGYAIDRALDVLRTRHGVSRAMVQGGRSSLAAIGEPDGGWLVAIGDPRGSGKSAARVRLHDQALGTSGTDNQSFEANGRRYGHVLDPRSGWPAEGILSASAIAKTAAEADALSTAFFILGRDGAERLCREHPGIGAVLVLPGETVVLGAADAEVTA